MDGTNGTPPEVPEAGPSSHHDKILVNADDDDQWMEGDICRVCRFPGDGNQLFHPCKCTGSIRYVHQHCLLEWLKYSKKSVCELCNHKFIFKPVYRDDMPERLPFFELAYGLFQITKRYVCLFLTYCLAVVCWLGLVPLLSCRIHRIIFDGFSFTSLLNFSAYNASSMAQLVSRQNVGIDIVKGSVIVALFICTFILLVFLREQIVNGPPELFFIDPPVDGGIEVDLNPQPADPPPPVDIVAPPAPAAVPHAHAAELDHWHDAQDDQDAFAQPLMPVNVDVPAAAPPNANDDMPAAMIAANDQAIAEAAVGGEAGDANDENWGRDVERIVEELTWQRLLGLDGSFVFIEHVLWMMSLNTIFIFACLYLPCSLGETTLEFLGAQTKGAYFESVMNFFAGYIFVLISVAISHKLVKVLQLKEVYWMLGFFYLMMKVSLLIVLEVFVFPSFCGWWLDICSLPLTGGTLSMRLKTLSAFPLSSVFIHWLVGMIDVFYSASFVLVLRELLRPGVLWFVRDLNDPEFQPIQEMIEQSFVRHFRRLVASTTLFFGIIFIVIFMPLKLITSILPSTLPYSFSLTSEAPLGEFSFELIILQVVLPTILEQSSVSVFLKYVVIEWCRRFGGLLGLDKYLLPRNILESNDPREVARHVGAIDEEEEDDDSDEEEDDIDEVSDDSDDEVPVVHRELSVQANNNGDDFRKPPYFALRIGALLGLLALTLILFSFCTIVLPVSMGRYLVYLMLGSKNPNDLYTVSLGLYVVWLAFKASIVVRMWLHQGWGVFCSAAILVGRVLVAALPLAILIPYLIGIYFQLLVVGPLRVASHQTPLYFPFKDWAMGLVHFKLFCASVFVGPDWWLKAVFERLYEDGIRGYNISTLYMQVVLPLSCFISFLIAFPYVVGSAIGLVFASGSYETQLRIIRYIYPILVSSALLALFVSWQWAKLKKLANTIRNDKYLIGTQLVNFYREGQLKFKQS
uniref:RING-type E3 ubiquitin transferase n=1 Tax=Panagrellus redivivus TaxID=6233 RepID=A0A7E5A273_PANRE